MTIHDMGAKRVCASCAAKFFDLNRDPIRCPKCDAVFVVPVPPPPRRTRFNRAEAQPGPRAEEAVAAEPADVLLDDDDEAATPLVEKDDDEPAEADTDSDEDTDDAHAVH